MRFRVVLLSREIDPWIMLPPLPDSVLWHIEVNVSKEGDVSRDRKLCVVGIADQSGIHIRTHADIDGVVY